MKKCKIFLKMFEFYTNTKHPNRYMMETRKSTDQFELLDPKQNGYKFGCFAKL